jgi:hypothetical protein
VSGALAVERELFGGAVSSGSPMSGEVTRCDPLDQPGGMTAIAERGYATHRQCEENCRQPGDRDEDEEHHDKGYAISGVGVLLKHARKQPTRFYEPHLVHARRQERHEGSLVVSRLELY